MPNRQYSEAADAAVFTGNQHAAQSGDYADNADNINSADNTSNGDVSNSNATKGTKVSRHREDGAQARSDREHREDAEAYAKTGGQPERTFAELGVPGPLAAALAHDGKTTAFPIQADTLPDSLNGRDVLGRGETGSGKTLAFSIPLVARLSGELGPLEDSDEESDGRSRRRSGSTPAPRAMVLAPTRELVNQIDEVIAPLAAAYDMRTTTIYGGVKYSRQIRELRAGAEIIVACPGRLEDLLKQGELTLEDVEVSVLDEADEMADMGFLPAVTRLLEQVRPNGQRLLFSATLDHGVDKVVRRFLHDAKVHEIAPANAQVDTMTHHVFEVSQGNKYEVIRELASGLGKRILFTRTKFQAKKMADKLVKAGIPAIDLQGNLSQNQRDRHLEAFTSGQVRVLVATDVAARGIDVSDVTLVVQTEPPEDPKSFLHRSGRTARAGESGDVVTLVLPQQRRDARQMLRRAGIKAKSHEIVPGAPELEELVGEHAPLVKDWTLTVPVVNRKAGRSGRGGRRNEGGRGRGRNAGRDERGSRRRSDRPTRGSRGGSRAYGERDGRNGRDDESRPFEGRSDRGEGRYRRHSDDRSDGGYRGGRGEGRRNPRYSDGRSEDGYGRSGARQGRNRSGRDGGRGYDRYDDRRGSRGNGEGEGRGSYRHDSGRDGGRGGRGGYSDDRGGRRSGRDFDESRGYRKSGGFHHGKNKRKNAAPFRRGY